MKTFIILLACFFATITMNAQSPVGAWERHHTADNGDEFKIVVIFSEGYQVLTVYDAKTGKFLHTNGGSWELDGNTMKEIVEFNTDNPEAVGQEVSFDVAISDSLFVITESDMQFTRIDDGTPGDLQGAWLMSGRKTEGEIRERDTTTPRKTMKILSGSRFQWIAYDTGTKEFMGTGGGTYTTENGKYTENIEFFSRDVTRVGASLEFDYELIDDKWHHSGLSSKGDPLYEIWNLRE